ncbi:MAG: hypothetical protein IGQ45_12410 [Cyanobacterium sp. T60_A2020_053]|nr:hypothetical protein [Cyanobacterium sp. T60_A2020_053]
MNKLMVISNGHGEDTIAVKIIKELQLIEPSRVIVALPMVGKGFAFTQAQILLSAPHRAMPSGGFIKQGWWQDVQAGLIDLTMKQYGEVRQWAREGGKILAVGDILPLFLAWVTGAEYAFVGTAKSEYYLRNEQGWLENTSALDRFFGSYYYPWERWLMGDGRCRAVFVRDQITVNTLTKYQIYAIGANPMMDGIADHVLPPFQDQFPHHLKILLLPGSRMPEALSNWQKILQAVDYLIQENAQSYVFISALAPSLPVTEFSQVLSSSWQPSTVNLPLRDQGLQSYGNGNHQLILSQNAYADCLHYSQVAIAMAGTATEQFVGLGRRALGIIGEGPQYNRQFAENQTKLLGKSVQLLEAPNDITIKLQQITQNSPQEQEIADDGRRRMGKSGASLKIAHHLTQTLLRD